MKIKNKKAQIFSLIAITLIGLMFVSFEVYSAVDKRQTIGTRISSMESFLDSVESNLERQMYVSGYRIIFLAENQITTSGTYIGDVDDFFNEAFFNGTIYGVNDTILIGATYGDIINSVNEKSKKINVDVTFSNPKFYVEQTNPWYVRFTLESDFLMKDKSGLAKWERMQNISTMIPISGFEDPVYIINSNARISKRFNQTIYEGNYVNGNDVTNLLSHVNNDYYAANINAPNFLQRLSGNLSADPNGFGIESFVNTNKFIQEGIPVYDKSKIDYKREFLLV